MSLDIFLQTTYFRFEKMLPFPISRLYIVPVVWLPWMMNRQLGRKRSNFDGTQHRYNIARSEN